MELRHDMRIDNTGELELVGGKSVGGESIAAIVKTSIGSVVFAPTYGSYAGQYDSVRFGRSPLIDGVVRWLEPEYDYEFSTEAFESMLRADTFEER